MIYQFDFSWGDTRGIREIMLRHAAFLKISNMPWETFGYPPHDGTPALKEEISKLIKKLTGKHYAHILVTGGATHALNAFVAAMRTNNTRWMYTNKLYFSRYPGIAKNIGITHIPTDHVKPLQGDVGIIDSPSNPLGKIISEGNRENIIWDAAYYSPTYCGLGDPLKCHPVIPRHIAMAGSLSKLTGLNGLRIGWLATDDTALYEKALAYVTSNACGISQPSQYAAQQILSKVDMTPFYQESRNLIDSNKTEMDKLGYLFGHQEVPRHGMFFLVEVDDKIHKLFDKASVKVMPGEQCGDTRDSVRFNLANSNKETSEMIKAILKADGK